MKLSIVSVLFLVSSGSIFGFELNQELYQKKKPYHRLRTPLRAASTDATLSHHDIYEDKQCLIFEDHFDHLNFKNWQHEITLSGGGNWEFQYYTNNRSNTFVEDGILYIKPTLTSDSLGENGVREGGRISLYSGSPSEDCTDHSNYGCERTAGAVSGGVYINPIQSGRLRTVNSMSTRYGKVEVKARLPKGDWLWPAIWMLPTDSAYGSWPASGEIDIMESRGNENYPFGNRSQVLSTLHWGPNFNLNKYALTQAEISGSFADDFHVYGLEWSREGLRTYVNEQTVLQVDFDRSSWEKGEFDEKTTMNPWKEGDISAPFDQEFYLILNLAVGGVNGFWPDHDSKPWQNKHPLAPNQFYEAKDQWLSTWGEGNERALAIDWVKVWSTETQKCLK
ncbi:concanavalin A-like lectin/glucanase domain-containing protein [Sporodiniella umbellata]|nr:concanavalin A-like lectin/glucanase domain-containing protein [Sporodiniella umbellata]